METLSYWLSRLEPLIRDEGEEEIICVFANRCGVEEEAVYSGTSSVLGIQSGEVKVYGILGRGEKELLVVDTSKRAQMQLISEPRAPTTQKPPPKPIRNPAEPRSAASASPSPVDSTKSVSSSLSVQTGRTSTDPPPASAVEACFSPVSPVDVKQAFFPTPTPAHPQEPVARPASRVGKERKPTPIPAPAPQDPFSIIGNRRQPTPAPHERPASPKSRNASRSRGPTMTDSPLLGDSHHGDIRLSRSQFSGWLDSPLLGELLPMTPAPENKPPSRNQYDDNRGESTSVDGKSAVDSEFDKKGTRPSRSSSGDSIQQESSFTRNALGPRSMHISPRPRSTVW